MRVLLIEDDDDIRDVVTRGLRVEGFDVDAVADGVAGLDRGIDGGYAAIILDLLLPGINGFTVCSRLRDEGVSTPILVMTAKSGEYDEIELLDSGADDFLTKPVSLAVLAARLRVLIRRAATQASNVVNVGALRYDLSTRVCLVAGTAVALTAREDQLLRRLLLVTAGGCVSRQELMDDVWGVNSGSDPTNLDIYLRRLRLKLDPVVIDNIRGLGYRLGGR